MPKRKNTDITKYTIKKGERYRFKLYLGVNEKTGKKIELTRSGFATYTEAQEEYNRLKSQGKSEVVNTKATFSELFEAWFKYYQNTVKESTAHTIFVIYENSLKEGLGSRKVSKITPAFLQDYFLELGNTKKSYKDAVQLAKRVFQHAVRLEILPSNPMTNLVFPSKEKTRDDNYYTPEELRQFLSYAKKESPRINLFFNIVAFTGMRRGEALALTWDAVDFKNKTIRINKTLASGFNGRVLLNTPKTKTSDRVVILTNNLAKLLKQYEKNANSDLIFHKNNGQPVDPNIARVWLNKVYKKAPTDFKKITVHGFRHTFATLLYELDTSITPKDVQKLLGHSTSQITMDIYTHMLKANEDRVVKALEGLSSKIK